MSNAHRTADPSRPSGVTVVNPSFGPERGTFSLNPRGFGFVTLHSANTEDKGADIFVGTKLIEGNELLDGDEVEVTWRGEAPKFTANDVTWHAHRRGNVLGVLLRRGDRWGLRVDPWVGMGERAIVSFAKDIDAVEGGVVSGALVGESISVDHSYGAVDSLEALRARALVRSRVADRITSQSVASTPKDKKAPKSTRVDLRGKYTFTIDGVKSRDLDDALSVEEGVDGSIVLYVHISDVAERVAIGSAEDVAARLLGTSVYLPGAVVTMLPEEISFTECSLIPHSDKLTVSVEMVIDPEGEITASKIYESIINSDQRLSYEEVARALDVSSRGPRAEKWVEVVELAHIAATRLGAARAARGGLTGPRVESLGVEVTSSGLVRAESDGAQVAHDLIEEAMVAANEVVAKELVAIGEGVFRIHETPGPEAAEALAEFARALGVRTVLGDDLSPRALSALERQLQERGVAESLWEALIGELGRAAYVPAPGYHFGLASDAYTHFTSPIRRYCDLSVHRILKRTLFGESEDLPDPSELCDGLNEATSGAAKAERYAQNLIELKWFSERFGVGSETEAKVLRVSKRGALVALADTGLRDWAEPPGKGRVLVAEDEKSCSRGSVTWRVGDSVRVRAGGVDLESGNIALVAVR